MAELRFEPALALADLPRGKMRACTIDGRSVLLCHTKDALHAVDNICTHAYARMDEGRQRGHRLICPLHGASFDCRTGAVLAPPASEPLRRYAVRLNGNDIEVALQP